jgi:hypothetical protein
MTEAPSESRYYFCPRSGRGYVIEMPNSVTYAFDTNMTEPRLCLDLNTDLYLYDASVVLNIPAGIHPFADAHATAIAMRSVHEDFSRLLANLGKPSTAKAIADGIEKKLVNEGTYAATVQLLRGSKVPDDTAFERLPTDGPFGKLMRDIGWARVALVS